MMLQTNQASWAAGDIAETIKGLEQQWASAAKANDPTQLALLLSEVFVEMDSNGTISRKPRPWRKPGWGNGRRLKSVTLGGSAGQHSNRHRFLARTGHAAGW